MSAPDITGAAQLTAEHGTSWTPGPWVVEAKMDPADLQRPWVQQAANPKYFIALACGDDTRNAYANARLIAAAPELFRELTNAVVLLRAAGVQETANGTIRAAETALAKARGEQS